MSFSSQGRDVRDYRRHESSEERHGEFRRFTVPYLILIGSQLPLALIYLWIIWNERPHYSFLPIALTASGLFLFLRWPRKGEPQYFHSSQSDFFLWLGIGLGIFATVTLSPWFAFAALLGFVASMLARINDRQVFANLLPAIAPLVVLLQPPLGLDFDSNYGDLQVMSTINSWACGIAGDVLDFTGYPHHLLETRMQFAAAELDSAFVGNGALSVFTLLIVTGIYIAWLRISAVRAGLLLLMACFWAMTFQAVTLVIFAIGDFSFEQQFSDPGVVNRIIQAVTLGAAALMTFSSNSLISLICGPVDIQAIDEQMTVQDQLCRLWNAGVAGQILPTIDANVKSEVDWAKKRSNPPPSGTSRIIYGAGILMIVASVLSIGGAGAAFSRASKSVFTDDQLSVAEELLPAEIQGWNRGEFENVVPRQHNPFDSNRSIWKYTGPDGQEIFVELDQPHSGWRSTELKLRRQDWKPVVNVEVEELDDSGAPAADPSDAEEGGLDDITLDADIFGIESEKSDPESDEGDSDTTPQGANVTALQSVDIANLSVDDFRIDKVSVPVEAGYYRDSLANYRYALTVQLDGYGGFIEEPVTWRRPFEFLRRTANRVGFRSRPRLFSNRAASLTIYMDTIGSNTEQQRDQVKQFLRQLVPEFRNMVLDRTIESEPLSQPDWDGPADPTEQN